MSEGPIFLDPQSGGNEGAERAYKAISSVLLPIAEREDPLAFMDGLLSVYMNLSVSFFGETHTRQVLRRSIKNVERVAAVMKAARQNDGSRA